MQTVKISGYSDDNIEIEGKIAGADEYGASSGLGKLGKYQLHTIKLGNGKDSLDIIGLWPGWTFLPLFDDDTPDFKFSVARGTDHNYSTVLTIDVPDDWVVMEVNGKKTNADPATAGAIQSLVAGGLDEDEIIALVRKARR